MIDYDKIFSTEDIDRMMSEEKGFQNSLGYKVASAAVQPMLWMIKKLSPKVVSRDIYHHFKNVENKTKVFSEFNGFLNGRFKDEFERVSNAKGHDISFNLPWSNTDKMMKYFADQITNTAIKYKWTYSKQVAETMRYGFDVPYCAFDKKWFSDCESELSRKFASGKFQLIMNGQHGDFDRNLMVASFKRFKEIDVSVIDHILIPKRFRNKGK